MLFKKSTSFSNDKIPEDLKYLLTEQQLKKLKELVKVENQSFQVRKYLKYPPKGRASGWYFLPADGQPHKFEYPPTPEDIANTFPEYGGGVYQVYSTKPMQLVYSINIDWMEPKEPFRKMAKEENEKSSTKEEKKNQSVLEKIQNLDVDEKLKSKLALIGIAKELGLNPSDIIGELSYSEDPITKMVEDYLRKHPEVLKEVAASKIKQLLGVGNEDELDKARRWWEFWMQTAAPMQFQQQQDPFMSMMMMFFPMLLQQFMPNLQMQQPQAPTEQLVKVRTKSGKILYMRKEDYERLRSRKEEVKETSVTEESKEPEQPMNIPPAVQEYLSKEPEKVAAEIISNEQLKPYIKEIYHHDLNLDQVVEIVSNSVPQYKPLIEHIVANNREWFEKLIEALKELCKLEEGEEEIEEYKEEKEEKELENDEYQEKEDENENIDSFDFSLD